MISLRKVSVSLGATVEDGGLPIENLAFGVLTVESFGRLDRLKGIIKKFPEMVWFVRSGSAETHTSLTYLLDLSTVINAKGIYLQNDHQLQIAYTYLNQTNQSVFES